MCSDGPCELLRFRQVCESQYSIDPVLCSALLARSPCSGCLKSRENRCSDSQHLTSLLSVILYVTLSSVAHGLIIDSRGCWETGDRKHDSLIKLHHLCVNIVSVCCFRCLRPPVDQRFCRAVSKILQSGKEKDFLANLLLINTQSAVIFSNCSLRCVRKEAPFSRIINFI